MTPVQMATMIKVYLDRIVRHAQRSEYEVRTVNGILMPEGRAYQDLQSNLKQLFEACDLLRFNLQDERSDLAPPTWEEMIAAVMSAASFHERRNAFGDGTLVCSVRFECTAQLTREAQMRTDVDLRERLRRQLAEKVMSSLSATELQRMVDWHRERFATAEMQADIQSKEQPQ